MHAGVKKTRYGAALRGATLLILLSLSAATCSAGVVSDSLKTTLDKVINILNDSALKSPAQADERRSRLYAVLKERFDEVAFARRALGKHWKTLAAAEKKEFVELFSDLLMRTYFEKIDAYLNKTDSFTPDSIKYLKEKIGKRYAVVETNVVLNKTTAVPVFYRLENKEGSWLVSDIAIEGVSLLKNYRVQFNEILINSSFKDLLERLKKMQAQAGAVRKTASLRRIAG
ncbi:ABC transporter substrate-binding protein [Thermodesulfobacteriota bacterium]